MRIFPLRFGLPNQDQKEKLEMWWRTTDRTFKLVQWTFFLALISKFAEQHRTFTLGVIVIVLWLPYFFLTQNLIAQFFVIQNTPRNGRIHSTWPEYIIVPLLSLGISYACLLSASAVIGAFVDMQASK